MFLRKTLITRVALHTKIGSQLIFLINVYFFDYAFLITRILEKKFSLRWVIRVDLTEKTYTNASWLVNDTLF